MTPIGEARLLATGSSPRRTPPGSKAGVAVGMGVGVGVRVGVGVKEGQGVTPLRTRGTCDTSTGVGLAVGGSVA